MKFLEEQLIVVTFQLSKIVFSDGGSAKDSCSSAPCTTKQQVGTFSKGLEIIENIFFDACKILALLFVCSNSAKAGEVFFSLLFCISQTFPYYLPC